MADLLVVGAGSAGAVIAGRAAVRHGLRVTLIEAGPMHDAAATPSSITGPNFHRALHEPGRVWPAGYPSGCGAGGSSAVNAMVAAAVPDGADGEPSTLLQLHRAEVHERGPLATALASAAPSLGLAADDALLTRTPDGRRWSVNDAYLEPARATGRLAEIGNAPVDRVLLERGRAVGVRLADGREFEAGRVVVSAGAVRSPAVLLRSGLTRSGIGRGLQDHPTISVTVRLDEAAVASWRGRERQVVSVTAVVRAAHRRPGDLQLLAADGVRPDDLTAGVVMVSLMSVSSRGSVRLGGPTALDEPVVEFPMTGDGADAADLDGLAAARALLDDVLATAAMRSALAEVGEVTMGGSYHATSTCRMGRSDDDAAVVDHECRVLGTDGLFVCDASVFPRVPMANPHVPVVLLAERMVAAICA
ncbi:MAG: hypothetical protein RJB61_814 [Actinomycetota bacterium]